MTEGWDARQVEIQLVSFAPVWPPLFEIIIFFFLEVCVVKEEEKVLGLYVTLFH